MNFNNIKKPSNKKFGLFFSAIFFIIFIYFYFSKFESLAIISLSISFVLSLISFLIPNLLTFLNKSWAYLGYFLSLIISPIIFGIIFYILITPISILRRKIGKSDELKLLNNRSKTYWILNKDDTIKNSYFYNQF